MTFSVLNCKKMVDEKYVSGQIPDGKDVYKNIIDVAWPAIVETILVTLIASFDTMMVGVVGTKAIASVGITNNPKFVLMALVISINGAVTAIVSRRKGQNDQEGANDCLAQSAAISIIVSIIFCTLGIVFARPFLYIAGAGNDIIDDSVKYFQIIVFGLFFSNVSLTINAAQRGVGNTKIAMRTNIVANIINLIFNYLLIGGNFGFPMLGVRGAAIATVLGNIVAFLMSLKSVLTKGQFLKLKFKKMFAFNKHILMTITDVSSSIFAEQLFLRTGFFITAVIIAHLGTISITVNQICNSIFNISVAMGDGLTIAGTALVGQSLGAKRPDMAIIYGKCTQRVTFLMATVLCLFFIFARKYLVLLFTKDEQVIKMAMNIMLIMAISTHVQSSMMVFMGCLRGAGDTRFVMILSLLCIGVFRPVISYVLAMPLKMGIYGPWSSIFIDCSIRFFLSKIRFSKGNWTKRVI